MFLEYTTHYVPIGTQYMVSGKKISQDLRKISYSGKTIDTSPPVEMIHRLIQWLRVYKLYR